MLVVDSILIAIVAVYGLNLLTGFAGLISIGHAAFVGVGAYTLASFSRILGSDHILLTHFWPLMILVAGCVGAVIGGVVGLPSLRLKHLYLVIATLSFQMIFQWFINFTKFFNQGQTIAIGRVFWFTGEVARDEHYLFWYYAILVIVVILGFAVRNLLRTRYGRCLVAVRDNDRAADAMGMHPGFTKVYAFALAGFFAGVAGALHAYLWRGVGFESFTLHHSISYLAMAIVGGLGTLVGSFVGPAAILMLELQVENLAEFVGHYFTALRGCGHGVSAALLRSGHRPVPDVRAAGDRQLVAHRAILFQVVAVSVLTGSILNYFFRFCRLNPYTIGRIVVL